MDGHGVTLPGVSCWRGSIICVVILTGIFRDIVCYVWILLLTYPCFTPTSTKRLSLGVGSESAEILNQVGRNSEGERYEPGFPKVTAKMLLTESQTSVTALRAA
jgi:hypothetical protein